MGWSNASPLAIEQDMVFCSTDPEFNFRLPGSIIWNTFLTTTAPDFTVWITDDLTETGQPVFRNLSFCIPHIYAQRNTTSNTQAPIAYGRGSVDGIGLRVACKTGNSGTIVLGGTYTGLQDSSNVVSYRITILGQRHPDYVLPPKEVVGISP